MFNSVVIHYAELSIKGDNKGKFITQLVANIKSVLDVELETFYGRQVIHLNENSNLEEIKSKLTNVFGISNFAFAVKTENDIEKIKQVAAQLSKAFKGKVKVSAKRSYKDFPLQSPDINREVGMHLEELGLKVDYKTPDRIFYIDVTEKGTFVYYEKIRGAGGLPVGTSGKVLMLLSGGIDSPVATYMLMKRGCKVDFVHFAPQTSNSEFGESKITKLAKVLSKYQSQTKLYWIPFQTMQLKVIPRVPAKDRLIVYRRLMFKMAETIAKTNRNYKAIATGECIGQVASQTLQNMKAVSAAIDMLILRPLAGFDKQEIIDLAQKIGTYEISIQPYDDCCSYMVPKHPELSTNIDEISKLEDSLGSNDLVKETIKITKTISFS